MIFRSGDRPTPRDPAEAPDGRDFLGNCCFGQFRPGPRGTPEAALLRASPWTSLTELSILAGRVGPRLGSTPELPETVFSSGARLCVFSGEGGPEYTRFTRNPGVYPGSAHSGTPGSGNTRATFVHAGIWFTRDSGQPGTRVYPGPMCMLGPQENRRPELFGNGTPRG